jgi:exonuclease I
MANLAVQSPSAVRVVQLTPGGTLMIRSKHAERRRIRLIDANGIPYPRHMNPRPSRDLVPQPGTTQITNVAPGTYTVQLLGDGDVVEQTIQVTVKEGTATEAEI